MVRRAGCAMNRVVESFPLALEAVKRVMDKNNKKDTDKPWADQAPSHHLTHGVEHAKEEWYSERDDEGFDVETGERHAAHAIARLLMYLELLEREDPCPTDT